MSIGKLSTIVYDKHEGDYSKWIKDFTSRVKQVYPEWAELHHAIEQNYEIAGRMLDDASYLRYNSAIVLLPKHLREIIEEKAKLYEEWLYTWRRDGLVNSK